MFICVNFIVLCQVNLLYSFNLLGVGMNKWTHYLLYNLIRDALDALSGTGYTLTVSAVFKVFGGNSVRFGIC